MRALGIAFLGTLFMPPPAQGQSAAGAWRVTTSRSEMTDQPSVFLQLDAARLVPTLLGHVLPAMYVRCVEEKLEVLITTGAVLDGDANAMTPIRIRWGSGPPVAETWSRSTDYSAAFAPDPWGFLRQLLAQPDLRLEFHPFDTGPEVIIFDARGLDRHLSTIEAACPISKDFPAVHDSGVGIPPSMGQVYAEAVVEEKPAMLSHHPPEYPQLLRTAGIEGTVIVQVIVDTMGRVEPNSIRVIRSPNPGFDQPVRNAVIRALFRPARVHGRGVRVLMVVPFEFKITGR